MVMEWWGYGDGGVGCWASCRNIGSSSVIYRRMNSVLFS